MRTRILDCFSSAAAVAVCFSMAVVLASLPASAQTLPAGAYQQSCKDASLVDGTLLAICRMNDQSWRASTLPNAQNCLTDIVNVDGKLQCTILKASTQTVPSGSYKNSCKNASVVDGTLLATCQMSDQSWRASTLPDALNCHSDIANINGKLSCVKRTTEFMDGYALFGNHCPKQGQGTEFLLVRMGGRPENTLKIVFDQPYQNPGLFIVVPKGTTVAADCGAFPTSEGAFRFKELVE